MTVSPATAAAQSVLSTVDLSNYDAIQSKLMDERCILVDENDKAIGAMDKKTCEKSNAIYFIIVHRPHVSRRPLDGKHQQGFVAPCILSIRLPTIRRQTVASTACNWENHLPRHVDKHLLFTSPRWLWRGEDWKRATRRTGCCIA